MHVAQGGKKALPKKEDVDVFHVMQMGWQGLGKELVCWPTLRAALEQVARKFLWAIYARLDQWLPLIVLQPTKAEVVPRVGRSGSRQTTTNSSKSSRWRGIGPRARGLPHVSQRADRVRPAGFQRLLHGLGLELGLGLGLGFS